MGDPMPSVKAKAAKIPTRRESTRTVKKPNRDLPEEPQVVGTMKVNKTNDFCTCSFDLVLCYLAVILGLEVCYFYAVFSPNRFFGNVYHKKSMYKLYL